MQTWKGEDPGEPHDELIKPGSGGLEDSDQRALMRLIFVATALTMSFFGPLQILDGKTLLGTLELMSCFVLAWCAWRVVNTRRLVLWIYLYLIPLNCFMIYIIVMPQASVMAFVWVYLLPVLCYLLLGRMRGFIMAGPFMLLAAIAYLQKYGVPDTPAGLIDLGNGMLCGAVSFLFVHLYETRRAAAQRALEHMAETDALTGVANRGSFQRTLERSIDESSRSLAPLVLLMMDVDRFKDVNDRYGHDAGDAALQHICNCLKERLRSTDTIGRLGGEEFGMLLHNTERGPALDLAEALRQRIATTPLLHEGQQIELSATFGLAQWAHDARSARDLYRIADQRIYMGKLAGRNQLVSSDLPVPHTPGNAIPAPG